MNIEARIRLTQGVDIPRLFVRPGLPEQEKEAFFVHILGPFTSAEQDWISTSDAFWVDISLHTAVWLKSVYFHDVISARYFTDNTTRFVWYAQRWCNYLRAGNPREVIEDFARVIAHNSNREKKATWCPLSAALEKYSQRPHVPLLSKVDTITLPVYLAYLWAEVEHSGVERASLLAGALFEKYEKRDYSKPAKFLA